MQPTPPRPSVMQLALKDKGALHAAYIGLFADGGIFVPTTRDFRLGDDLYLLLTLPDDPQRYPVAGKVGWVTPAGAGSLRPQGVGVRLGQDAQSVQLRARIEQMLGASLGADRATHTL